MCNRLHTILETRCILRILFFAYQQQGILTITEGCSASMNLQTRLCQQVPVLRSDLFEDQPPLEGIRIERTHIVQTAIYTTL